MKIQVQNGNKYRLNKIDCQRRKQHIRLVFLTPSGCERDGYVHQTSSLGVKPVQYHRRADPELGCAGAARGIADSGPRGQTPRQARPALAPEQQDTEVGAFRGGWRGNLLTSASTPADSLAHTGLGGREGRICFDGKEQRGWSSSEDDFHSSIAKRPWGKRVLYTRAEKL